MDEEMYKVYLHYRDIFLRRLAAYSNQYVLLGDVVVIAEVGNN